MRHFLVATLFLCVGGVAVGWATEETPMPRAGAPTHASVETAGGLRIHAVRLGQIQIKSAHEELQGRPGLRFPRIFLDTVWAAWMPILAYVVEHPEGAFLVDTGPSPRTLQADYFRCDRRSPTFYERNLRFSLEAEDTLAARLTEVGVETAALRAVLITHFHSDHVGGLEALSGPVVYTGAGNWPHHVGAFTCRLPEDFAPTPIDYTDGPAGGAAESRALTADGRVRLIPLPGHTPGHAGLLVEDGGRSWLMAGDATFSADQTARGAVSGVTQQLRAARDTQARLRAALAAGTVLLPAHDWSVFARLPVSGGGDGAAALGSEE